MGSGIPAFQACFFGSAHDLDADNCAVVLAPNILNQFEVTINDFMGPRFPKQDALQRLTIQEPRAVQPQTYISKDDNPCSLMG